MDLNNIKRNQLDYILTDMLPTELSERFTFFYFYEFLMTKRKELKQMNNFLILIKNKYKTGIMFEGGGSGHGGHKGNNWVTMPLKYSIMKELHTEREISLLQPIAAVELFAFVSIYQKELINLLDMNSIFSLRHHHKNNELCYKNKNKSITKYFAVESAQIDKDLIEKTGMFFDIKPYKSIASFTSSEEWLVLNSKYRYFIRTDYKACFDSIYTHTFKWLIGKDVNDTKDFKNTNIYTTIDRILQNINARTSNGIVVGPEFSRMIAEILLQAIDRTVYSKLLNSGKAVGENYNVYRFVDDIFIFAESEELANEIVQIYSEISAKYLLRLNEGKLYKNTVPFVLDEWINETSIFANRTSACLFRTKEEQEIWLQKEKQNSPEKEVVPHILKSRALYYSKSTRGQDGTWDAAGADGVDGLGGLVWAATININDGQEFPVAFGEDTTFGAYSSANGKRYDNGYTDVASGDSFARTGVAKPRAGTGDGGAKGIGGTQGRRQKITWEDEGGFSHSYWKIYSYPGVGADGAMGASGCAVVYWDKEEA